MTDRPMIVLGWYVSHAKAMDAALGFWGAAHRRGKAKRFRVEKRPIRPGTTPRWCVLGEGVR